MATSITNVCALDGTTLCSKSVTITESLSAIESLWQATRPGYIDGFTSSDISVR